MKFRTVAFASTAGVIAAVAIGSGAAQATSLIGSHDIKDNSVRSIDVRDGGIHFKDLGPRLQARILKHAKDGADGTNGVNGAPGSVAGIQTNWVANPGSEIQGKHTVFLLNADTPDGTSVQIDDLNLPVQAQQKISFTYELHDGAVYGAGVPRVYVEMQGTFINTFDGDPSDAGVDNGDGTFTKTVTIGKNGRIGQAGVVKDFGAGSVTVTNLTIAGHVLDFS